MKIKILENDMIEKIAAGEVIERPVSAVKELIENGVDAGASTITIEISGGGKDLIRVTDNGSGIEEADLENVFKRHATSKIETLNDLENVLSLGFRGEAMAAIATVSTVTLSTKTEEQSLGNIIELRGGVITKKEKKAMQKGTTIVVRNLFFNVPARRKFLKNNTTEASQIESLTAKLALANPHISFTYINEGTTKIKSLAKNLEETIYNIYGNEFRGNLIEISCLTEENIKITGFAAKPFIFKNNRNFQSFFVNGRYIKSSILTKAVEKAYKTKVPIGKFPCFVLCVTIDPASVDVNAHPTKMEIRFDNDNKIEGLLEKCVDEALREKNLIPKITTKPKLNLNETQETFFKEHSTKKIYDSFGNGSMAFLEPSFNYEASKIYEDTNIYEPKAIEEPIELSIYDNKEDKQEEAVHLENENKGQNYDLETENIEEKVETKQPFFNHYKIIGVFLDTYWIVEQSKSLYIIDQHAAHERILYDEYSEKGFASNAQRLLTPIALTLTDEEELLFKEKAKILEKMGFDVESFGTSYAIRAVPNIIKNITAKDFLEILNGRELTDIARKACKAAVKAHDKLSITEATELIKKLLKTPNPFTCPHGRPTIVEVTKNEIEKMFLRIM